MERTKKKRDNSKRRILRFDDSEDRLLKIAEERLDDGNYLAAMRFLNRCHSFYDLSEDSCAMLADACEMIEANGQALRAWYGFLSVCQEDDESLAEAYEGLAVNYMNLGMETQAAYYYNQLMRVDENLSEETKMEIVELFSRPRTAEFHVVWPPEEADYTATLNRGTAFLKEGKIKEARQTFSEVPKGAKQYAAARNLIAVAYLLEDDTDAAGRICEERIAENGNDVQAYTTYAALLGQTQQREKAREVAEKLCKIETSDSDEIYKIATVCCENGMHEEAYGKFCRLEKEIRTDKTLLYFKAVSAYQCGRTREAIETFERLLTIYPDAAVARFYYDVVRAYEEEKDKKDRGKPELSYFYRVPEPIRNGYCEILCFLCSLNAREAEEAADNPQVQTVLQWCFDEGDGNEFELQLTALQAAVRCGYDKFTQNVFLNPDVSDFVKLKGLEFLTEKNRDDEYGVVICHIYRNVVFRYLHIGVKKHRRFLEGYAQVYSKFAMLSEKHAEKLKAAAEFLYACLVAAERCELIDRTADIACAVYLLADFAEGDGSAETAIKLFSADSAGVEEILVIVRSFGKMHKERKDRDGRGEKRKERKEKTDE